MIPPNEDWVEGRDQPRLKLPAMYTYVRARRRGDQRYRWTGHVYDISESGMRLELDEPIEFGTEVEVRAMLPGREHIVVEASGRIVRFHDEIEEPGPVRMGMMFDTFTRHLDRQRLTHYLDAGLQRAA